jgi:hypothetical protein
MIINLILQPWAPASSGMTEYDVAGTEQTLRKCYYRWSRGLSASSSSGCPEGRHPANKKIYERGIGRFHEFLPALWSRTQFRTDGSPDGVQPCLQNCFANSRFGLNEARKWKIRQSGTRPPACDTMIESLAGDSQMDVEDGFRALLEKINEHKFDKVPRIN